MKLNKELIITSRALQEVGRNPRRNMLYIIRGISMHIANRLV